MIHNINNGFQFWNWTIIYTARWIFHEEHLQNLCSDTLVSSLMTWMKNIFKTFARHVSIKHGDLNFHHWKQQVEGIIWIHKLHLHLVNSVIPIWYLIIEDRASDTENPAYLMWQLEDSLLFTWLLTALSTFLVRCIHAHEVRAALDQFQKTQINVKSWWWLNPTYNSLLLPHHWLNALSQQNQSNRWLASSTSPQWHGTPPGFPPRPSFLTYTSVPIKTTSSLSH